MSEPKNSVSRVDHQPLVRPSWWTGADENDWPEDFSHENGNYLLECARCGKNFAGHKRRHVCKKCKLEDDARWQAMTETERQAEFVKMAAALEAWQSDRTNATVEARREVPPNPSDG